MVLKEKKIFCGRCQRYKDRKEETIGSAYNIVLLFSTISSSFFLYLGCGYVSISISLALSPTHSQTAAAAAATNYLLFRLIISSFFKKFFSCICLVGTGYFVICLFLFSA